MPSFISSARNQQTAPGQLGFMSIAAGLIVVLKPDRSAAIWLICVPDEQRTEASSLCSGTRPFELHRMSVLTQC